METDLLRPTWDGLVSFRDQWESLPVGIFALVLAAFLALRIGEALRQLAEAMDCDLLHFQWQQEQQPEDFRALLVGRHASARSWDVDLA